MDIRTQRLNEAFNASGMTQTELCNKTGITKGALSSYLSGRYFPKQRAVELLANALNVPIPYLLGWEEEMYIDENGNAIPVSTLTPIDEEIIEKVHKLRPDFQRMASVMLDSILDLQKNAENNKKGR